MNVRRKTLKMLKKKQKNRDKSASIYVVHNHDLCPYFGVMRHE